tara:strand:+ start:1396 stop:1728 length:333 start_codon:yes stop_codon:yes gene_type:complete
MGMFDMLSGGNTDFFGNIFNKIGTSVLKKGFQSAFGSDEDDYDTPETVFPTFTGRDMGLYNMSAPGKPMDIKEENYDIVLAMWNKRLFGQKSYTNTSISLPKTTTQKRVI